LPEDAAKVKPLPSLADEERDDNRILQGLPGEELDAADHFGIPIDDWYCRPRWARVSMIAHLRKLALVDGWREKWREDK